MSRNAMLEKNSEVSSPERVRGGVTYTPQVDILETPDELVLYADLPGVHAEDLNLRFENGELLVEAKCQTCAADCTYLLQEYGTGDFYRVFAIGETIDSDRIGAELKHGVLTVHLPKSEAVKPKRITVKGE